MRRCRVSAAATSLAGKLKLRVLKDTFGWLPFAAVATVNSNEVTGALSWKFTLEQDGLVGEDGFRPTTLMERVSRFVQAHPVEEKLSPAAVEEAIEGKRQYVRDAMDALTRESYLEESPGARGARLLTSVRPYREADDDDA